MVVVLLLVHSLASAVRQPSSPQPQPTWPTTVAIRLASAILYVPCSTYGPTGPISREPLPYLRFPFTTSQHHRSFRQSDCIVATELEGRASFLDAEAIICIGLRGRRRPFPLECRPDCTLRWSRGTLQTRRRSIRSRSRSRISISVFEGEGIEESPGHGPPGAPSPHIA